MISFQEELIKKYEGFKPELEKIIASNNLANYMRERFLTGDISTKPPLESPVCSYNGERPCEIIEHFIRNHGFAEPIVASLTELIDELGTNPTLAQNKGSYSRCLVFSFVNEAPLKNRDDLKEKINKQIVDVLKAKSSVVVKEPWFSIATEADLLSGFNSTVTGSYGKEIIDLLFRYVNNVPKYGPGDSYNISDKAGMAIAKIDYKEGLKALKQLIIQGLYSHSPLVWYLSCDTEPKKLAGDLRSTLNMEELDIFLKSLGRSLGSSKIDNASDLKDMLANAKE